MVDENTGEVIDDVPAPIAVVSDNGSCFRGETYQSAFAGDKPLLRHVRTRVRSPQTNGVIERFFGTLKYEHLYRAPIDDGLGDQHAGVIDAARRSRRSSLAPVALASSASVWVIRAAMLRRRDARSRALRLACSRFPLQEPRHSRTSAGTNWTLDTGAPALTRPR
jgi:transposase InsO family protein